MTHFTPSSWLLDQMIAKAMGDCDADIEQARLREVARREARREQLAIRGEVRAAAGRHQRRMWGL